MTSTRLTVDNALVTRLLAEVAPLVEQETGWDLGLASLQCAALPRERGYEEIVCGRLRSAGIALDPDEPRILLDRLLELVLEANLYAAYDPGSETILVIRENVDDGNLAGLRVILAHELVHRGQHLKYPELFARADQAIREIYAGLTDGSLGVEAVKRKLAAVQSAMTLIESHAAFVQRQIAQRHFPDAQLETNFNLLTLLFRLAGGAKLSQYTDGLPLVASAASEGRIDGLYRASLA